MMSFLTTSHLDFHHVCEGHEFKIDLEDEVPLVHHPLYKMSLLELEEVRKQIESMLEHGFVRPSDSPYGAPVLFVPKSGWELSVLH